MPKNLKVPTTFQRQLAILQSRNVIINDAVESEKYLQRINYYRLSGYLYPFQDHSTGICISPINFDRIISIYSFDASIRNLIVSAIEDIEIYARTQLAYHNAHTYGSDGYMNPGTYNQRHNHPLFLRLVSQCIKENSNSPAVRHHNNVYGGKFPIWVIIDYFSLGMISHFYADLPNPDKSYIAQNMYSVNYQLLMGWFRCLTDLRNRCAHYSRLYNWSFPAVPGIPKGDSFIADHSLFSQLYLLKLMYPYPEHWNDVFIKPLAKIINKHKNDIDMSHIGFPYRWKSILTRK